MLENRVLRKAFGTNKSGTNFHGEILPVFIRVLT